MKVIAGICMILGCFVGAGFASGREIAFYFSRFGSASFVSIVYVVLLLFLLIWFFFKLSRKVNSFNDFVKSYFGKFSFVANLLLAISILILIASMIAGTKSLAITIGLNSSLLVGFTLILTFFIILGNIKALSNMNIITIPILLAVLMLVSCLYGDKIIDDGDTITSIISGNNYVFINIMTLGLFILEIGSGYTKKEQFFISLGSSMIIGIMLILLNITIQKNSLVDAIMPCLELAKKNKLLFIIMQICIYFGLFTTLLSNVYLLSNYVNKFIKSYKISIIIVILISLIISCLGFDIIVGYVYCFIGIVGIIMVINSLVQEKRISKITYSLK